MSLTPKSDYPSDFLDQLTTNVTGSTARARTCTHTHTHAQTNTHTHSPQTLIKLEMRRAMSQRHRAGTCYWLSWYGHVRKEETKFIPNSGRN